MSHRSVTVTEIVGSAENTDQIKLFGKLVNSLNEVLIPSRLFGGNCLRSYTGTADTEIVNRCFGVSRCKAGNVAEFVGACADAFGDAVTDKAYFFTCKIHSNVPLFLCL